MRLRAARWFVHCSADDARALNLPSDAENGQKNSIFTESSASQRGLVGVELEKVCEHNHWCAGKNQRIVGWWTKTSCICIGGSHRSAFDVVRWADKWWVMSFLSIGFFLHELIVQISHRTGLVHGTQCSPGVEENGTKRQNYHRHNPSAQLGALWNVWQNSANGWGSYGVLGHAKWRSQLFWAVSCQVLRIYNFMLHTRATPKARRAVPCQLQPGWLLCSNPGNRSKQGRWMPCNDQKSLRFFRCQLTGSRHQQCGCKHCKLTGKYSVQVSNERRSISCELVHTILCNLVEKLAQRTQGTDAGQSSDTADDSKLRVIMILCNITMSRQKTLISHQNALLTHF